MSHNKNMKAMKNKIKYIYIHTYNWGLPGGSDSRESAYNAEDLGSIPGLGRSPGEGTGSPLQHSCLKNPMDRGAWWATVRGVANSLTRLSNLGIRQTQNQLSSLSFCIGLRGYYLLTGSHSQIKSEGCSDCSVISILVLLMGMN